MPRNDEPAQRVTITRVDHGDRTGRWGPGREPGNCRDEYDRMVREGRETGRETSR
ncbi:hypothetical protein AB0O28_39380 [Microbispora sp. NPDC088329]|uniref:hypothetical protein n=1 Tax=Microbispora sp. NPDC088329 TaxID=3154869 RepID=UPI00342AB971